MLRWKFAFALVLPALIAGGFVSISQAAEDWPSWRGPNRDGVADEKGLLKSWSDGGPNLVWQTEGTGDGFSSVVISKGRLFTMGKQKQGGTAVVAFDITDGSKLWEASIGGGSPNCTPTTDGEIVLALGRDGDLVCLNAADGKEIWRKSYKQDFGGRMMSGWGYSESPLIDGDRVICTPGANDAIIAALDKKTGKTIWKSSQPADVGRRGRDGAAYSSVIISNGAGVKQYVQMTGRGLISVAADDGRTLWVYNRVANGTANVPTPIVKGDYIFCSSGYGTGAGLVKLSKNGKGVDAEEVYFLGGKTLQNHHGGMILVDDHIYMGHGHNNGFPICVEFATGKIVWGGAIRGAGSGSAAIIYADGNFIFRYQSGEVALIAANPKKYDLRGSFKPAYVKGPSWSHPVVCNGKLYLREKNVLMCYDLHAKGE